MDTEEFEIHHPAVGNDLDDPSRLRALDRSGLLDSPPEESFDRITGMVTRLLHVPVSLVSIVDDRRQFFKSAVGLDDHRQPGPQGTPLTHSFCQYVVLDDAPLVIDDAYEHPFVATNLAIENLGVVAYLGVPLRDWAGQPLGALCAIDRVPRRWSADDLATLESLAGFLQTELQLREVSHVLEETQRPRAHATGNGQDGGRATPTVLRQALADERETADHLRQLNRMKSTFLTAASHELRRPATSIVGFADVLVGHRDRLSDDEQDHFLRRLSHQAHRLERLLDEILDVDRLTRSALTPHRRSVELEQLIRRVVEDVDITTHPVTVEGGSGQATVDSAQIERVVENLLHNAAAHTPPGTPVRITVGENADGVTIVVEDEGPGIPEDLRQTLFDPFVRDPGAAPASEGTGVGLTLVRELVNLHGGRVEAENRPGGGARMCVRLPLP